MAIVPDTKDWTWVLRRPCPECGMAADAVHRNALAPRIDELAGAWAHALRDHPHARTRPSPTVWSPLEYGCHVRDVLRVCGARNRLMLTASRPVFASWDQDAAAIEERYGEQDPARVATEIEEAGAAFTAELDGLSEEQWERSGSRGDGAPFTVDSLTRYVLHEIHHHLHDVAAE